jgi:hypothetical protein
VRSRDLLVLSFSSEQGREMRDAQRDQFYSVYVTQQKDGRWDWANTLTKPPIYWKSPEVPAGTPEQVIAEARFDAERRIDAM